MRGLVGIKSGGDADRGFLVVRQVPHHPRRRTDDQAAGLEAFPFGDQRARADQAIRALYKTGFFNDVQLGRQGDILVVTVKERPQITKIAIRGNKDLKEEDLRKGLKGIGLAEGEAFDDLAAAGARVQRCLWASTSTKNPVYRDVMYAEELIGPKTVDTLPTETILAFLDHGVVSRTLDVGLDEALAAIRAVESLGIRMETVTDELTVEGVAAFTKSFEDLMGVIDAQRKALAPA